MNRAHWSELPGDWSDDEKLAGDFLAGWPGEIDDPLINRFFEPASDEEKEAQAALVRVLRRIIPVLSRVKRLPPATTAILSRIAGLLDRTHPYDPRQFVIEDRPGAAQRITENEIVAFIEDRVAEGCKPTHAVEEAAEKFGRETRTIWRVRERHEAKK